MKSGPARVRRRAALAAAAALALASLAGFADADELKFGGIVYKHVTVVGIKEGKVYYESGAGEQTVELRKIQSLKFAKYPDLARADDAMEAKDLPAAIKLYTSVANSVTEDFLKALVGAKLVHALDQSNQYGEAVRQYATLLTLDSGALTQEVRPKNIPADANVRGKLAADFAADLKAAKDPEVKKYLAGVLEQLRDPTIVIAPANPEDGGGNVLLNPNEAQRDLIAEMIKAGQAEEALKAIDAALNRDSNEVAKLFFQRGQAQAALNQDMESLISLMRVVIHYPSSSHALPALIEAGKVYKKLGKNDQARSLWQEALKTAGSDEAKSKELNELLGSIK